MKVRLPLMKVVLTQLMKSVLFPLTLTATVPATDAAIPKKIYGSNVTTLIISNEEIKNFMDIVKSLEESILLIKSVSKTVENEAK